MLRRDFLKATGASLALSSMAVAGLPVLTPPPKCKPIPQYLELFQPYHRRLDGVKPGQFFTYKGHWKQVESYGSEVRCDGYMYLGDRLMPPKNRWSIGDAPVFLIALTNGPIVELVGDCLEDPAFAKLLGPITHPYPFELYTMMNEDVLSDFTWYYADVTQNACEEMTYGSPSYLDVESRMQKVRSYYNIDEHGMVQK